MQPHGQRRRAVKEEEEEDEDEDEEAATATMTTMLSAMTIPFDIDATNMEKIWAKEQYQVEHKEREATAYELHSVESRYNTDELEGDPQRVAQALQDFDTLLTTGSSSSSNNNYNSSGNEVLLQPITFDLKRNYLRAVVELQSTYVVSEQFRIKFLRTEFFQIHQAVVRYLLCLNLLEEYFGDLALLRPILLEDLTKREQKIFKAGCRQLLPSRDTLGRRSIVNLGNFSTSIITDEPHRNNPDEATTMTMNDTDQLAFIRIDLYFKAQVLAEDISTQRNGFVKIQFIQDIPMRQRIMFANNGRNRYNLSDYYQKSIYNLPIRMSGLHICFPGSTTFSNKKALFIEVCKPLIMVIIGKKTRAYLRIHTGTNMECNYSLQSFGIPVDDIPRTGTGTPKLKNHVRFFKCRQAVEKNLQEHAVRALATSSSTAFLLSPEQLRMNASMASITSSGTTPTNMFMNMNMDASGSSVLSLPPQFETRNKKKSSTSSNKKPALSNKELKEVKKKRIKGYRLLYQISSSLELPSQLKSKSMATTTTTLQPPYIECPDFNCVLFRKNGLSYQHPGNVKFRDVLHRLFFLTPPLPSSLKSVNSSISDGSDPSETVDETLNDDVVDSAAVAEEASTLQLKTKKKRKHRQPPQLQPSNSYTVETVLHHSFGIGLQFLLFDEQQHWYVEMTDPQELRNAISRAMNYTKRRIIVQLTKTSSSTPTSVLSSTKKDTPTTTSTSETNRNKKKRPRNHPAPDNNDFNNTGMLNPTFGQQQQQLSRQASLQHQNFGGCFLNMCGISTNNNTNNNNTNNTTNDFLNSLTYTNHTAHHFTQPEQQQQQQQHPQRNAPHPYWQQDPNDFAAAEDDFEPILAAEDDFEPIQIQSLIPSPALPPQNPLQPQASTVRTMDDEMFDLDTTFIHTVE